MKALLTGLAVAILSLSASAISDIDKAKIEFLISSIEKLDATFIRNNQEHTAKEAANHLRKKVKYVLSSSLAENLTVESFIDQIASKSSLTGEPYLIHFSSGVVMEARVWFYQQLELFP